MEPCTQPVTSEAGLGEIVGTPGVRAVLKERATLAGHCRAFIVCRHQ
jgi:hypothetical protein